MIRPQKLKFLIRNYTTVFSGDMAVDDLGDISRSLDCFTSNFSHMVRNTANVTIE